MTEDEIDYERWADLAEAGLLRSVPGSAVHGEEAAASGRKLIFDATGTDNYEDAVKVALGRPRLDPDTPSEKAPMWRVRATPALDKALRERAKQEGRTLSEVLRRAAAEYLMHA